MSILNNIPDKREDRNTTSLKFKEDILNFFNDIDCTNFKCIEVGTNRGYTTKVLSSIFKNVVTMEYNQDLVQFAMDYNRDRTNIEYLQGDVYEMDWGLDTDYNVAFIDCVHTYKAVKQDIKNCLSYGVDYIIFDDYGLPDTQLDVKAAIDEFINENKPFNVTYIGEPKGNEPRIGKPLVDWEGVIIHVDKTKLKKKVFIDAGANMGQSIENFIKHWNDWRDFDIHSFEANPRLVTYFEKYKDVKNINFYNKAVWIYDGEVEFYLCNEGNHSSSIIGTKISGRLDKIPTIMPCVDIGNFITTNYKKDDYIILKLDIEGGEYELLEHLISTNAFEYVDKLYLEFHTGKVGKTVDDNIRLLEKMKSFTNMEVNHETYNALNFL